ncbi:hypothetical protein EVAR_94597_1 [Eumeta japonica]|uniref:Uncharacterized protein n=1 Tax=Eumeta variegata TaxID=151549 RepID=A0A4C1UUQ9_EUMVA|nr:hypothetical protein EVAR_94597_1 [Eumeta japonica]
MDIRNLKRSLQDDADLFDGNRIAEGEGNRPMEGKWDGGERNGMVQKDLDPHLTHVRCFDRLQFVQAENRERGRDLRLRPSRPSQVWRDQGHQQNHEEKWVFLKDIYMVPFCKQSELRLRTTAPSARELQAGGN